MATNDGYSPYTLGMTAAEAATAITRAANLSTELLGYVGYTGAATPPTIAGGANDGDVWYDSANGLFYRAQIDVVNPASPVLIYFEI